MSDDVNDKHSSADLPQQVSPDNDVGNSGIDIVVQTRFLPEQSDPLKPSYAFAYTITLTNHREEPVKLLERHWVITDQNHQVEEVRGKGVVGKQPILEPGRSFTYSSGAILTTETGDMRGSYTFQSSHGERFEAPIPLFVLALPHLIH